MFQGKKIDGKRAKQLVEKGAVLIDVRSPVSFRDGTLPGAVNVSLRNVSTLRKYPDSTSFILFSDSSSEDTLRAAVNYIIQMGFERVYELGDMSRWNTEDVVPSSKRSYNKSF